MLLRAEGVYKQYGGGDQAVQALRGVTLAVDPGEFLVVMGPSGSGKSTLLQILGALDVPSRGVVSFKGSPLNGSSDAVLSRFRREHLGFIFQSFHLLPTLTAAENVALPLLLAGGMAKPALARARELLGMVALADRAEHRPSQLSGGQMQRVAVARALVADPEVLLADEPTGNLDSASGHEVLRLLKRCQEELHRSVIMVTHDPRAVRFGTRLIELRDGELASDAKVVAGDVAPDQTA